MMLAHILTPLEDVLRNVLTWLHESLSLPWAWAIVALTVIVRMVLVPLTVRQIHSMQNLQRHAPEMKEIQRKYKQDRRRQQEEMMKFYRENKINPAASCLPLLAQLPVFFALYLVLRNFDFEEADPGASLSWLHFVPDITANAGSHWSGYVLLLVYAASQTASTLFMSTTMDKTQRYILLTLPIAFLFVVINFPAGLVLYWMTTNLWTVGQGIVTRRLVPKTPAPPRRSSRTPPKEAPGAEPGPADDDKKPPPSGDGKPQARSPQQVKRVKRKKKRARR